MIYSYRKILQISLPILLGLLIQNLIGVTDTAFLGRVGATELGASALAGVFYITVFVLAQGYGIGVQIITARRNGEADFGKIGAVNYQGVVFLTTAAVITIILLETGAPALLKTFISSPAVYDKSLVYLKVRVFGFLFAFPLVIFRAFYVGITRTAVLTWSAVFMLLANVFLDYVLIFGHFGLPAMGIAGAALASVLAEALTLVFCMIYMLSTTNLKKYGFDKFTLFDFPVFKEIWKLSTWTILQYFISMITWLFFFLAIEHLGETELAVSNILRSITVFPFMLTAALGAVANTITGNLIGARRPEQVLPTGYRTVELCYGIGFCLLLIMMIFPRAILHIYTDDVALINQAIIPYYAALSVFAFMAPSMVLLSIVSGSGQTKAAMYMELGASILYTLDVWFVVLHLRADLFVCWTCEHSYYIPLTWLVWRYLHRKDWSAKLFSPI